jgi:transposase
MRNSRVWARMPGAGSGTIIEGIGWEETPGRDGEPEMTVVARVRVHKRRAGRCGVCGRRCPGYDKCGRRRWRAPDLGLIRAVLEGGDPRVSCPEHHVVVAQVPWARHKARHTRAFEDTVAWLACVTSKTTICELMRIGWRAVGHIITRVAAEAGAGADRLAGLRRIGIDEISYRKGTST